MALEMPKQVKDPENGPRGNFVPILELSFKFRVTLFYRQLETLVLLYLCGSTVTRYFLVVKDVP